MCQSLFVHKLSIKISQMKSQATELHVYKNVEQFLDSYQPLSSCFNLWRISNAKMLLDEHGKYYGQMKGNEKNGLGVYLRNDQYVYEGNWENNKKNWTGFEKFSDGTSYQGEFVNGKRNGKGLVKDANGASYDGQWVNGERDGAGVYKTKNELRYIGEWKSNKMHGYGVLNLPNQDRYEGNFKEGQKSGKGSIKYKNGNIYKGYFDRDEANGYGQLLFQNENYYKGEFKQGKFKGPGQLKCKQKSYQGYFKNNQKCGYGVCNWKSGSCFRGFFEKNLRHGFGEMFWLDGNVYRGWWKDGVQHGKGQLFVVKQGLMKGIFSESNLVILTEHLYITRKQYLSSLGNNPQEKKNINTIQEKLNHSRKKQSKTKIETSPHTRKLKKRVIKTQQYSPQPTKKTIEVGSMDKIQFPLLFRHHSHLKNQKKSIMDQFLTNKSKNSRLQDLQKTPTRFTNQPQRNKKFHSALGVHRRYQSSFKNSLSTMPNTSQGQIVIWNEKLFTMN